jgi:hypothetical protein
MLSTQTHSVSSRAANASGQSLESSADVNDQRVWKWRSRNPGSGLILNFEPTMRSSLQQESEKARVFVRADTLKSGVIVFRGRWRRILDQFEFMLLWIVEDVV